MCLVRKNIELCSACWGGREHRVIPPGLCSVIPIPSLKIAVGNGPQRCFINQVSQEGPGDVLRSVREELTDGVLVGSVRGQPFVGVINLKSEFDVRH